MIWYLGKKTCLFSLAGGTFCYPLAQHIAYPLEVICTGFGCGEMAALDASGRGGFLPGKWMATI